MPKRRSETTVTTRGKGSGIFQLNQAKQEKWLLPCFIPFPSSLHSCREFGKGIKLGKSHSSGLLKWSGKFWSDRRSTSGATSRGGPEYSGLKKPKRTFPFDFRPKFPESSAWWKACTQLFSCLQRLWTEWHKTKVITLVNYKGTSVTIQWTNLKLQANTCSPWKARENMTNHWFTEVLLSTDWLRNWREILNQLYYIVQHANYLRYSGELKKPWNTENITEKISHWTKCSGSTTLLSRACIFALFLSFIRRNGHHKVLVAQWKQQWWKGEQERLTRNLESHKISLICAQLSERQFYYDTVLQRESRKENQVKSQ